MKRGLDRIYCDIDRKARVVPSFSVFHHRRSSSSIQGSIKASAHAQHGMAGVPGLHKPEDFYTLAKDAIRVSEGLRQKLISGKGGAPLSTLLSLDAISNAICNVIDVAEFTRRSHGNPDFREAAENTFSYLSEYIGSLNTDVRLYEVMCMMTEGGGAMAGFTGEQRKVALSLKKEAEKDGIHLKHEDRQKVLELFMDVQSIETTFDHNGASLSNAGTAIQISRDVLNTLPSFMMSKVLSDAHGVKSEGKVMLALDPQVYSTILKTCADGEVRRKVYEANNSMLSKNVVTLEQLMAVRHKVAKLLGFQSFAHRATIDKVAETPEKVMSFLESLADKVAHKAQAEILLLMAAKAQLEPPPHGEKVQIYPWDIEFYKNFVQSRARSHDLSALSAYLPLDRCLEGLAQLCYRLFGIEVKQMPVKPDEDWSAGKGHVPIIKLALTHPNEGELGHIYLDLGPRPGKHASSAHYAIRCGCKTGARDGSQQLPVVALLTSFGLPHISASNSLLLSHGELTTLLHEFGHALHSLLSRTELQHHSGTRGPTDWVETPSTLFEYFAWDIRSLDLMSGHHATGKPIPREMGAVLKQNRRTFAGVDLLQEVLYCLTDQLLFGRQSSPPVPSGELVRKAHTSVSARVHNNAFQYHHGDEGAWHGGFGHFSGAYGASYYSYAYSRVFAANIWDKCFAADPLSRSAGMKLWKRLLIHGGAEDPLVMLKNVLDGAEPTPDCLFSEWDVKVVDR